MRLHAAGCLPLVVSMAFGCTKPAPSPVADLPPLQGLVADPDRLPKPSTSPPEQLSVSQILCIYRGAQDAYKKNLLDRAQARMRAGHLQKLARSRGQEFAELSRRFSDDAQTSPDGGYLGVIGRGELHPDLESAAFGLEVGQVSEVVESPRGFHILQRHAPLEAQVAEMVITYDGALRYTPRRPRTREQARALAQEILERLRRGGSFEDEARTHSDLQNHDRGGIYPIFRKDTHLPQFEQIVWSLPEGGLSDVVDTPTGFHIVKRLPVERIQVRHILIDYRRSSVEDSEIKRSRPKALELAEQVQKRALDPEEDFPALAAEFSDDPTRNRGGLTEPFGRGQRPYDFERAAFSLQVDGISGVVETKEGFYIIRRVR